MSARNGRFQVLLAAGITGVVIVGSLLVSSGLRNNAPPPRIEKVIVKEPCDVQLLVHDEQVLDKAYSLAITGHHDKAFAEVGKHYAAMDTRECQ